MFSFFQTLRSFPPFRWYIDIFSVIREEMKKGEEVIESVMNNVQFENRKLFLHNFIMGNEKIPNESFFCVQ